MSEATAERRRFLSNIAGCGGKTRRWGSTMRMSIITVFVLMTLSCSRTPAEANLFDFEPQNRSTFGPVTPLKQGARLQFAFYAIEANEEMNVFRCGEHCNTAKFIGSWSGRDLEDGEAKSMVIEEEGEYYFWMQQHITSGETGPVFIDSAETVDGVYRVKFQSGSEVGVRIEP